MASSPILCRQSTVDISDGLLDVIILQQANLAALFEVLGNVSGLRTASSPAISTETLDARLQQSMHCWQAKEITIESTPPGLIQADGELIGEGKIHCTVLLGALKVFVADLTQV